MTNHEHLAHITWYEEPVYIEAFKMIIEELQDGNPEIDFNWCLPKYRGEIEWLNSKKENIKDGDETDNFRR